MPRGGGQAALSLVQPNSIQTQLTLPLTLDSSCERGGDLAPAGGPSGDSKWPRPNSPQYIPVHISTRAKGADKVPRVWLAKHPGVGIERPHRAEQIRILWRYRLDQHVCILPQA